MAHARQLGAFNGTVYVNPRSDELMEDDEDDEDFDAGESDDGKDPSKPKRAPPIQLKGSIRGGEGGVYRRSGGGLSRKSDEGGVFELTGTSTRRSNTEDGVIPAHLDLSGGFEIGTGDTKNCAGNLSCLCTWRLRMRAVRELRRGGARTSSATSGCEDSDGRGIKVHGGIRNLGRLPPTRTSQMMNGQGPRRMNQLITEAADFRHRVHLDQSGRRRSERPSPNRTYVLNEVR